MDNQNRKLELLGNAPIPKALLAMGIPTMIGMLINALYNLVDAYFVGGLGESQMAAISVVYPLGQVVVGLGLLFGNGAASYISRLLGQRNKDQANKVASTALYSSLVVGAIMNCFINPLFEPHSKTFRCNRKCPSLCGYLCRYLHCFLHFQCF